MARYIPKDALVAEIDNRIKKYTLLQQKPEMSDLQEFKHGQEALMKDAVDGLVVCDELTHGYKDIAMHIPDNLEVGNKVKLIIIKTE